MAYQEDIALMAHLMRRAGFGAGRDEIEARAAKGYEATVEELLHPEAQPPVDAYTLLRYQPASLLPGGQPPMGNLNWMFYLVNTQRPLEEKVALFWHHVFATGNSEVDNRESSRAFTGWTFETKIPRAPYGRFPWKFEYRPEDHDDGEKTFLGHKGKLNGETSSTSSYSSRLARN